MPPDNTRRGKQSIGQLAALNRALEKSLRRLLRTHRRHLDHSSVDDAEEEEDELERQSKLLGSAARQPSVEDISEFEQLLERRERALRQLEKKLHKLSDEPAFPQLLGRFEKLLKQHGRMLGIFEVVLKLLPQPQPELVRSFEDLLEGFEVLIASFARLLDGIPAPSQRLLLSFADLLEGLEGLLKSFEDLLDAFPTPPDTRLESFEDLLRELERLLGSFEDLLRLRRPPSSRLLGRFEDLLEVLEELIESFGHLLERSEQYPDLSEPMANSFAGLVDGLEALLKSFAKLLSHAPPSEPLLESFEDLLHQLSKCLNVLRPFAFRGSAKRVGYFEVLLHQMEDLLARFEALLKRLRSAPVDFLVSFEAILKELQDLLKAFEDMVSLVVAPEDEPDYPKKLVQSFDVLIDDYEDLIDSLQGLKEKLPEIPEALLISDVELLNGLQNLMLSKINLLSTMGAVVQDEVEGLVESMARAKKLAYEFADICSSRRPISGAVTGAFSALVAQEAGLLEGARRLAGGVSNPSALLRDGIDDLVWLQGRLEESAQLLG